MTQLVAEGVLAPEHAPAQLKQYIKIARFDHWIKNMFMLPGVALAVFFSASQILDIFSVVLMGVLSTCLASSANYAINEYLDVQFDRFHPLKKNRSGVVYLLDFRIVLLEYVFLATASIVLAYFIGKMFLFTILALLLMGLLYNVQPVRLKDRAYLDVMSESINNPLRLVLGWSTVIRDVFPPSSILIAYWAGGAFLMAVKRYSEYRRIGDHETAGKYRRSFLFYTEEKLLLSCVFYAVCSSFFLGIFLIKYRIEFLLTFPLFALLFTWYLAIGLKPDSAAQAPEKLYKEGKFLVFFGILCFIVCLLLFIDLKFMEWFTVPISLK